VSTSDNAIRLRSRGAHVESHFLKAVSPDAERALWIKQTLLRPKRVADVGIAEVWAIAFERGRGPVAGAKDVHPLEDVRYEDAPFSYRIGGASLTDAGASGTAESSGHRLEWRLELERVEPAFRPFPRARMYRGRFPKQKTLTPVPSAIARGEARVDGERWSLDGFRAMQGHNWGLGHSERYAWVHCNGFEEPETWVELMTARVRTGGILLPWLSVGGISIRGERHRFDGAGALLSRAVSVGNTHYRTTLDSGRVRLDVDVETEPEAMAGLHYENPDGSMTHCLNSKLARGSVTLVGAGAEPIRLRSDAFALEIGTKDPDHPIRMLI
jgi:hypothetical protein